MKPLSASPERPAARATAAQAGRPSALHQADCGLPPAGSDKSQSPPGLFPVSASAAS